MNITNFFKRILILLLLSCFLLFIPGCDVFCIRRWFCIQLLFNVCVASIILFCTNLYSVCSFHTWCYHVPLVGSCRCDNLKLTCIQSRLRIMTRPVITRIGYDAVGRASDFSATRKEQAPTELKATQHDVTIILLLLHHWLVPSFGVAGIAD